MVISLRPPRKFAIRTWFCNCPQYLCLFSIVFECNFTCTRKDVGSPKSTSLLSTFHIGSRFCFFPANFMSSTYTDKNTPFHDVQRDIPNWKPFPNRAAIGFSHIAFPIIVLPKDDHTDSFQEERLDLPYWTMILAICVVDESKCLDTPILEFSIICEHLPFLLVYKPTKLLDARIGHLKEQNQCHSQQPPEPSTHCSSAVGVVVVIVGDNTFMCVYVHDWEGPQSAHRLVLHALTKRKLNNFRDFLVDLLQWKKNKAMRSSAKSPPRFGPCSVAGRKTPTA